MYAAARVGYLLRQDLEPHAIEVHVTSGAGALVLTQSRFRTRLKVNSLPTSWSTTQINVHLQLADVWEVDAAAVREGSSTVFAVSRRWTAGLDGLAQS